MRAWLLMSLERSGGAIVAFSLTDRSIQGEGSWTQWVGEPEELLISAPVSYQSWQDWAGSPSCPLPAALWGGDVEVGRVQIRVLLFTSVICWDPALHSGCPAWGKDPLG